MTDLWTEASLDHDEMARTAAMARADAELQDVLPFLLLARSAQEYQHRRALAERRLEAIALRHGVDPAEVLERADAHFALYAEAMLQRMALPEGENPLAWVPNPGGGSPAEGYEHDEAADFSHGYSEIPQGAPGGPDPAVTVPKVEKPAPVQEAAGAKKNVSRTEQFRQDTARAMGTDKCPTCGLGLTKGGKCKGCKQKNGCTCGNTRTGSLRRQADVGDPTNYLATLPPDTGTGQGSVDLNTQPQGASLPAGGSSANMDPIVPPGIGQVTSSADPVHRQVISVAASIAAANPGLDESECRRVARKVVGRYLTADLTSEQVSGTGFEQGHGGGGSGGDGGGGGMFGHYLEGRGIMSMLPGGGGGAAAEGGGAAGVADLAELAAL